MGTLATAISRARVKIRDTDKLIFTDAQMLGMINEILQTIHDALVLTESNLVYAEGTIITVDGTGEYTPSFNFDAIMDDGVWLSGEDWFMPQLSEADKIKYDYETATSEPEAYYITEDGKIGFLQVPDDAYTIHVQYFTPLTELTDVDNDDLPWAGLWNSVIERMLIFEALEIQERDVTRHAIMVNDLWNQAMGKTLKRGCRPRKNNSDMFSVEGI